MGVGAGMGGFLPRIQRVCACVRRGSGADGGCGFDGDGEGSDQHGGGASGAGWEVERGGDGGALRGIVEPLLPKGSTVRVLMAPGRSEHGYEFTPSDLAAVARADVVVYIGLALEPRISQTVRERPVAGRRVVCFAEAVGLQKPGEPEPNSAGHHHHDHDHEHGEECNHGADWVDQHLWLDPGLVEKVIPALRDAVASAYAGKVRDGEKAKSEAEEIGKRAEELAARVRKVDGQWRAALEPYRGRAVVTHHNAFPRAAERYGFEVAAVLRTIEGKEPTPGEVAAVVSAVRERGVGAIFIEDRFSRSAADRIAKATGVRVLRLEPLGDGDWFKLMEENLKNLVEGLAEAKKNGAGTGEKPSR